MALIHLLDELTINQIAAGEVVESPVSVLKELVENAVDAGATQIEVEIKGGGFQLLRVVDNGCGMGREDLAICLLRHATSKIQTVHDLQQIATLGFRGEALASVAAISHLRIATSEGLDAFQLTSGPGGAELSPCSRAKGTSVEVRELFYNVPARKAFQKSASASAAEISRVLGHLSLAYPHISFIYTQGGKRVELSQRSPPGPQGEWDLELWRASCARVMGESFEQQAYPIDQKRLDWQVKGLLGHPLEHRPNRSAQLFVVNQRLVQAPQLSRAVQEGYGTRLSPGRFPQFVLHLTLPGPSIDVNVHPQKRELRFKDPGRLASWLSHLVNLALSKPLDSSRVTHSAPWEQLLTEQASLSELEASDPALYREFKGMEAPLRGAGQIVVQTSRSAEPPHQPFSLSLSAEPLSSKYPSTQQRIKLNGPSADLSATTAQEPSGPSPVEEADRGSNRSVTSSCSTLLRSQETFAPPGPRYLASAPSPAGWQNSLSFDLSLKPLAVWKRWSLWSSEELARRLEGWEHAMVGRSHCPLVWMSSSRALARLRYDQAMQLQPQVLSQTLLLPLQLEMRIGLLERLPWEQLEACGFELTQTGPLTVAVDAIPVGLSEEQVKELLYQLTTEEGCELTREKVALGIARQIEHHTGQVTVAVSDLILGLSRCQEKFFTPLGRAIFRPLPEEELEIRGR